ncbi:MAG: phosphate ABC transporter permease PstA [Spirochaetaceae bacterium]|nr:phosphate ABC transporter permease PstA [Spirochaetaceae bacterium]MDE0446839.1 phosphate ABC transporter permease PstA [Spirochaetaceae bacterium]
MSANLPARHRAGLVWRLVFHLATAVAIVMLTALLLTIVNRAFGLVAMENAVDPAELARDGVPLERMNAAALTAVLADNVSRGLMRRFEREQPMAERSRDEIYGLVVERVVDPSVVQAWSLWDSLFRRRAVVEEAMRRFPNARLVFRSWLTGSFIADAQSSIPEDAGVRAAIKGSLGTILITILFAFPVGVGAAIYLEEYARDNRLNRVIQTNINNLSGVPSIIYGMLGLTVFVRAMEPITSGALFGLGDGSANGRTILSAGLTLGLLILPVIIINAQEAIKAVPDSLRQSSYGLGATKWQTIRHHVLPSSFDRILTGTILATSRAIGETAPMVVVGASTLVTLDPSGPFSKFTTLPIQIYQWTARPQAEFRNAAAAAILVLLVLLLTLNATAILLRNYHAKKQVTA